MLEHTSPFLRRDSCLAGSQGRIRCDGSLTSCCWHGTGYPPACPRAAASPGMGRSHVIRKIPLLGHHIARGGAMLLWTMRTRVVMPGWHVWEPAYRTHTPLLYELEAICPKCGFPGLDLCCVPLPAHKEENGQVCPSVSGLWSAYSCCPERCRWPGLRQVDAVCCRVRAC